MKDLISVPLPKNLRSTEYHLYQPYIKYRYPVQKIKRFKNAFVSFTGFCLDKRGLIKECHHDYPFQHDYYLNEVSKYYYDVIDTPENLISFEDDNTYLVIHHPWYNYYHWICESIFRLWLVRKNLSKVTLLLPEYYKTADFIQSSLEPFNIKDIYYIPNGKSLLVSNLCLPQIKPICDSYNRLHINQVRQFYTNYIREKRIITSPIERLYISRKLAPRRKVINEDEIHQIIVKYGFTVFYPENHSFFDQVSIFSNVKFVVGTHGSGLTNTLFMDKNTSILELHKNKTHELNHPSFLFWYMAEALQINYYHQSCGPYDVDDYFNGDYIIDAELFEQNIDRMIKDSESRDLKKIKKGNV